jgi:hypothetical protein
VGLRWAVAWARGGWWICLKDLWCGLLWVEDVVASGGCGGGEREVGGGVGSRWVVVWIVVGGECGGWSFYFFYFFCTSH